MDYQQALSRLLQLVDYERLGATSRVRVRYDLGRMEALLRCLGNPHQGVPTVHIAGTKGKGSTAAMCASVLTRQGYRTGLYTSPHLHTFRERISIDGYPVTEREFASLVDEVWPAVEWVRDSEGLGEVTMFEILTAMALRHFRRAADCQVIEVGLGGRLDTTNLVEPWVCTITSLSLDHTSILGDTLECIAREKAGIIKSSAPVVTAPQPPEALGVIESVCSEKGVDLVKVGEAVRWEPLSEGLGGQSFRIRGQSGVYDLWTGLLGEFQMENAATAVGALELLAERGLPVTKEAMKDGFRSVSWPCRMEVLQESPLVVCDGAHNPHSVSRLRDTIGAYFGGRRLVLVVGMSRDKNMEGMATEIASMGGDVIATQSRHPRAAAAAEVSAVLTSTGARTSVVDGVGAAVGQAISRAGSDDLVLVTGSLFVAAEARESIKGIEPEIYPQLGAYPHVPAG